jgi:hydrogenase maturation protease
MAISGLPHRTLVLGMGNPILSDDAVGVRLARDLEARLGSIPSVDFLVECSVGGLNLLDVVAGFDRLVVLDAIRTRGGEPGSWYAFTAARLRETRNLSNIHDVNFSTALELGRRLDRAVPRDEDVHIFAVEILDDANFSETMTEPLEARYPEYSREIFREVEALLRCGARS